jgi:hemolysin activation/secretion protein
VTNPKAHTTRWLTRRKTRPHRLAFGGQRIWRSAVLSGALLIGLGTVSPGWGQTVLPDLINAPELPLLRRLDVIPPEAFEDQPRPTDTDVSPTTAPDKPADIDLDGVPTQPLPQGVEQPRPETPTTGTDGETAPAETFKLEGVNLSGITVFQQDHLSGIVTPYINQNITYSDLETMAAAITKLYHDHGYVTSRAFIPAQEVKDNMVKIQVIEGRVADIKIEGNHYLRDSYIRGRIPIEPDDIFQIRVLEEQVFKLNQDPLIKQLKVNLAPGQEFGTSNIEINVKDARPIHLSLSYDNQGRKLIGFYRYNAQFRHDNVLGFGDNLFVQGTLSNNYNTRSLFAQYKVPLNQSGWSVGVNYALGAVDIGGYLEPVGIHNRNNRESIFTEFPVLKTKNLSLSMDANLTGLQSVTTLKGYAIKEFTKVAPDAQRSLGFGANLTYQDPWGRTIVRGSSEIGIGFLGGNIRYSKYTADILRVQRLWKDILLVARGNAQWSSQSLSSLVQYQAGGANTVRGFLEGEYIGDKGYVVSAELRCPLYGMPQWIRNRWQAVAFVDHGGVYTNVKDNGKSVGGAPGHLVSMGAGLRGSLSRFVQGSVDFALIGSPMQQQPTARIHFNLSSQLF